MTVKKVRDIKSYNEQYELLRTKFLNREISEKELRFKQNNGIYEMTGVKNFVGQIMTLRQKCREKDFIPLYFYLKYETEHTEIDDIPEITVILESTLLDDFFEFTECICSTHNLTRYGCGCYADKMKELRNDIGCYSEPNRRN